MFYHGWVEEFELGGIETFLSEWLDGDANPEEYIAACAALGIKPVIDL